MARQQQFFFGVTTLSALIDTDKQRAPTVDASAAMSRRLQDGRRRIPETVACA
jgi:hypothetical protein